MKYSYFEHPNNVCMSYLTHAKLSLGFSIKLISGSIKAFIHACIPSLYITSTSDLVTEISNELKNNGCHKTL